MRTNMLKTNRSAVSFDFINDGEYDYSELGTFLMNAVDNADVECLGCDFREVDYSGYPEYKDKIITQGGIDFRWIDTGLADEAGYIADDIESYLAAALEEFGYELIGIDFYSID